MQFINTWYLQLKNKILIKMKKSHIIAPGLIIIKYFRQKSTAGIIISNYISLL